MTSSENLTTKKPKLVALILDQVRQETEDEWKRPRCVGEFRSSELGGCKRRLQYSLRGYRGEHYPPELVLLLRDGDLHHNAIRETLAKTGRLTNVEDFAFKRYRVEVEGEVQEFTITTHTDGIFNQAYLVDIKSINPFSFQKLTEPYIKENYEHYLKQIQCYMDVYDLPWACLLFKDKAFARMKEFWYERNPEYWQATLVELAKLHRTTVRNKWVKRPYTQNSKECKGCPMRIHCWNKPMESNYK